MRTIMLSLQMIAGCLCLVSIPCHMAEAQDRRQCTPPEKCLLPPTESIAGAQDVDSAEAQADAPAQDVNPDEAAQADALYGQLLEALSAPPPQRAKLARELIQAPGAWEAIDRWIDQTVVDHPQNLVMRDLLEAMPIQLAGTRLVALAMKSADPAIQDTWKRRLSPYPQAYAHVLTAWLKNAPSRPEIVLPILQELSTVQPDLAVERWAALIENYPLQSLERLGKFGVIFGETPDILARRLTQSHLDEISQLRLSRMLIQVIAGGNNAPIHADHLPAITAIARTFLEAQAISRRIVGIDLAAALRLQALAPAIETRYREAKNTTERAHALIAGLTLQPGKHVDSLTQALMNGDEALRLAAARYLASASHDRHSIPADTLKNAMLREIWPEIQALLYTAIVQDITPQAARSAFQRSTFFDPHTTALTRQLILNDLASDTAGSAFRQEDFIKLLEKTDDPQPDDLDAIASIAEYLYTHDPAARENLQKWLVHQRPLHWRFLRTFAHFIHVDRENDNARQAMSYMRPICKHAPADENTLLPCTYFFEEFAESDEDKTLLNAMKARSKNLDTMLDLGF